jgi:hypothetical protein
MSAPGSDVGKYHSAGHDTEREARECGSEYSKDHPAEFESGHPGAGKEFPPMASRSTFGLLPRAAAWGFALAAAALVAGLLTFI